MWIHWLDQAHIAHSWMNAICWRFLIPSHFLTFLYEKSSGSCFTWGIYEGTERLKEGFWNEEAPKLDAWNHTKGAMYIFKHISNFVEYIDKGVQKHVLLQDQLQIATMSFRKPRYIFWCHFNNLYFQFAVRVDKSSLF